MRISYPVAAARSAVVSTFTNQFVRNLLAAVLLTGFDGSVLVLSGQTVYAALAEAPWLAVAFVFAAFGLIVTLARIWVLTIGQARVE